MRTCIVDLVSLLRGVCALHEYLYLVSRPSRPSVLFLPCHFFFLSVACTLSSFCAERKCATEKRGISPELTVTCANGRVRKIYLLEPNILRALVPQSPYLSYLSMSLVTSGAISASGSIPCRASSSPSVCLRL